MTAFSDNILPLLQKYETKLQICEPSKGFINMVLRKIKPEQVVSLHLTMGPRCPWKQLPSLITIFTNVTSLTLLNPQDTLEINHYEKYFPMLTCLSLWYDNELSFHMMRRILLLLSRQIRRLEIHCGGIFCPHYLLQFNEVHTHNDIIEYFLLDVGCSPLSSMNECVRRDKSCFLMTTINFIKIMKNIQYVRLVTNKYNLDKVRDLNEWTNLLDGCRQLKKVTIETLHSTLPGEQLVQKAMEIQSVSRTIQ
jgi:hypothetical protein